MIARCSTKSGSAARARSDHSCAPLPARARARNATRLLPDGTRRRNTFRAALDASRRWPARAQRKTRRPRREPRGLYCHFHAIVPVRVAFGEGQLLSRDRRDGVPANETCATKEGTCGNVLTCSTQDATGPSAAARRACLTPLPPWPLAQPVRERLARGRAATQALASSLISRETGTGSSSPSHRSATLAHDGSHLRRSEKT